MSFSCLLICKLKKYLNYSIQKTASKTEKKASLSYLCCCVKVKFRRHLSCGGFINILCFWLFSLISWRTNWLLWDWDRDCVSVLCHLIAEVTIGENEKWSSSWWCVKLQLDDYYFFVNPGVCLCPQPHVWARHREPIPHLSSASFL